MLPFAYYILKVIICSAVLYGYYWFFLRNKIFHSYNRFYLLAVIALSLSLPLLKFNIWQKADTPKTSVVHILQVVSSSDEYMDEIIIQSHYRHVSKEEIAMWIFITISFVFALIFITAIMKIYLLKKNNPLQHYDDISLIHTNDKRTPFSFLKNIFWNDEIDINSMNGKRILKHEVAHVKEKHSHDKLFINIVLIFYWCNPVFWLIRRELNMIHEFIADKKAVEDGDTATFAAMILQASYPGHRFELTNNFFYSPIKRRLSMLTKNKTKVSYISRLLVLPLAVIVFAAFTLKTKTYITSLPKDKIITVVIDAGHGGTDNGATTTEGIFEKDITPTLAKKIQELNKSANLHILLTRDADIYQDPKEKAAIANKSGADLFISLHVNNAPATGDERQTGMSVFVARDEFKNTRTSKLFAAFITSAFRNNYLLHVPENPSQSKRGITVLEQTTCPSVLIEAGFVSNKNDLAYLRSTDGQDQFAKNVLNAITNFVLNKDKNVTISPTSFDTIPAKQLLTKNNKATTIANPAVLADLSISIMADTFEIDQNNSSNGNDNALLIINGKEFKAKDLSNKKIVAKQGLLYEKNDPAMLKQYGTRAQNGVLVIENANIIDITNDEKKPSIDDYHLSVNMDSSYAINASQFTSPGDDYYDALKKLHYLAGLEKTQPLLFVNGKPENLTSIQQILPELIQRVQVLKGKDALNKYGDKAQNGAVEVTLKNSPEVGLDTMPNKIFTKVEQEPAFPGGKEGWKEYLQKNINAAMPVDEGWKPGTYVIVVNFLVDKEGNVSNVSSDDHINSKTTQQCINLIKNGPKWIPAKQNGKTVNAYRKQPITFVVSED